MGTVIKHPVPDRVKPSFVIFDTRCICSYLDSKTASTIAASIVHSKLDYCNSALSVRVPGCQKLQMTA